MSPDEDEGDDSNQLDCWELKDPSKAKSWTAQWAPHTAHLTFATSYKGPVPDPMVIDHCIKLTDFEPLDANILKVVCATTSAIPYNFTIAINTLESPFDVLDMMESLEPSNYDDIKATLRKESQDGEWRTSSGTPLRARVLARKLRNVVQTVI